LEVLFSAHDIEYFEADSEYIQLNQTEVMEAIDDSDDHWDRESTGLMLNLYLQNIDKFRNPKIKKKNVWLDIATAVGKGAESCDKKFRNLKMTYVRLLKKKNKDGPATFKWPYFDVFEEIYNVDGGYQPEIQQKIQDSTNDSIAKALLLSASTKFEEVPENGETSQTQSEEVKRRLSRKRNAEFRKATIEMRDRQRVVEGKLDRLISIVEESNSIQRERNRLFQQFLDKLNHSH
ncbi:uncharacterized protein, partial [Epargyreus clarus]|uniref:uncharacterized protein n=1 Tax=Epargyreus clarus TaxID=520877 RepID=UPI003C303FB2